MQKRKPVRKEKKERGPLTSGLVPNLPLPRTTPASPLVVFPQRGKHLAGGHADASGTCLPAWCPPTPSTRARRRARTRCLHSRSRLTCSFSLHVSPFFPENSRRSPSQEL